MSLFLVLNTRNRIPLLLSYFNSSTAASTVVPGEFAIMAAVVAFPAGSPRWAFDGEKGSVDYSGDGYDCQKGEYEFEWG